MALTDDEKTVRRKVVGISTRLLRDHIGVSQTVFAQMLGDDTDLMAVSKYERGVILPHPHKRKMLAAIAKKHGRPDLEAAFLDPIENWPATLPGNARYLTDLMTLLEICAINQFVGAVDSAEDDFWYEGLAQMASMVRDRLVKRAKDGATVLLVNDRQRDYWFGTLEELGVTDLKRRYGREGKKPKNGDTSKKTR